MGKTESAGKEGSGITKTFNDGSLLHPAAALRLRSVKAALENPQATETRGPSAIGSIHMSDREKAGLRSRVRKCVEESIVPDGSKYLTTTEYTIEGKFLTARHSNPDGSEWVIARTYDPDGRLVKIVYRLSGGPPDLETLDGYDDAGRLFSITNSPQKADHLNFRYDAQGRKTSIQTFAPETLQRAQNASYTGSAWDATPMGMGVPVGGSVTTLYDQNDRPTEQQTLDAQGQLIGRLVRTYDANGQISLRF